MKRIVTIGGLSARRKTKNHFSAGILGLALCVMLSSCHDRSSHQAATEEKQSPKRDSLYKPKVNIQVNRRYDEKGNVVAFDSTYSTYYSNFKADSAKKDSLFKKFDRYFERSHSSIFDNEFNNLFFKDSIGHPDFFHNDFFMKRYEMNGPYMRDMMRRMDSVKNRFFQDEYKNRKEAGRI
jgi:hypothetical protein